MKEDEIKKDKDAKSKLTPELYDLYAPPVYGKILSIVQHDPIAEKIHEKVFISAFSDKSFPLRSPLMSLVDIAKEKSAKTIKALEIFSACCSGSSISIKNKKDQTHQ